MNEYHFDIPCHLHNSIVPVIFVIKLGLAKVFSFFPLRVCLNPVVAYGDSCNNCGLRRNLREDRAPVNS